MRTCRVRGAVLYAGVMTLLVAGGPTDPLGAAPQQPERPAAEDRATFDVVSIRRSDPDARRGSWVYPDGRVDVQGQTVLSLIRSGYRVESTQLTGGPDWIRRDLYTVQATASGNPDAARQAAMMRNMLADRFKLVTHTERRDVPTYVITVARPGRLGAGLTPRTVPCAGSVPPDATAPTAPAARCGPGGMGGTSFQAYGLSMANFANLLSNLYLNAHVVDRTGLTGSYDIALKNLVNQWTDNPIAAEASDPSAARLPAAMEEQLGLKLEMRREPMEVVVIDSIERPSEN